MQALPFLAVAAPLVQGIGGLVAGNANARAAEGQAIEEERAGLVQRQRVREDARRKIGEQAASLAGSGFMGASAGGTALDALRESQVEAALDTLELRRQGALRARSLRSEAKAQRRSGKFALLEGVLGAGSKYIGQRSDWAQARSGS